MLDEIEFRLHYHDNDGLPDQLEVVRAPATAAIALATIRGSRLHRLHIHDGHTLVFGTPDLGRGRVAYTVVGWDSSARALDLALVAVPTGCPECAFNCCGMHNRHCEPLEELCCGLCTEIHHPGHANGSTCVLTTLEG